MSLWSTDRSSEKKIAEKKVTSVVVKEIIDDNEKFPPPRIPRDYPCIMSVSQQDQKSFTLLKKYVDEITKEIKSSSGSTTGDNTSSASSNTSSNESKKIITFCDWVLNNNILHYKDFQFPFRNELWRKLSQVSTKSRIVGDRETFSKLESLRNRLFPLIWPLADGYGSHRSL